METRPDSTISGDPSRYRAVCEGGVWWFITPEGKKSVSLGINHLEAELMLGEYNLSHTLETFGKDFVSEGVGRPVFNPAGTGARKWMEGFFKDMGDWNFDTLAYHTEVPVALFAHRTTFVKALTPYRIENYATEMQFPDVFSGSFAQAVEAYVKQELGTIKDKARVLGYAFSDIPSYQRPSALKWVAAICRQEGESAGKQKWIELLKKNHRDPHAAAEAHSVQGNSWDELSRCVQWSFSNKTAESDVEEFVSWIAEGWIGTLTRSVKKYDPQGLILGDKLNLEEFPGWMFPILGKYVDVINIQFYGILTDQAKRLLSKLHERTGKPILIGDHAITTKSKHQEAVKGENAPGCGLSSHKEVGEHTSQFIQDLMRLPYIVGWHLCGYVEGWKGLTNFWQARQCGLKDPFGKPHMDAITPITEANRQAEECHQDARIPFVQ